MNIKPAKFLFAITILSNLICIWPTDPNSHYIKRFIKDSYRYFMILNAAIYTVLKTLCLHHFRHDVVDLMEAVSEMAAVVIPLLNLISFKWKEDQVRVLLDEVLLFMKTSEKENQEILHKWVNCYASALILTEVNFVMAASMFAVSPLFTAEIFPTTTWYPFEIELYTMTYYVILIHQTIAVMLAGLGFTVDLVISFMFCYLTAKLEILGKRIEACKESEELNDCIKEHKNCIEFFNILANSVEFILTKNMVFMTLTIICSAIPLLTDTPLGEATQFLSIIITSYMRSFMTMWPPDNVRDMSEKIATSLYKCSWIGASKKMQTSLTLAIFRAQRPLIVAIPGVLPPSTLQYYATYLSTTFSYFTALRALVGK